MKNQIWIIISFLLITCLISQSFIFAQTQENETSDPIFKIWPVYLSKTKVGVTKFLLIINQSKVGEHDTAFVDIQVDPPLELLGGSHKIIPYKNNGLYELEIETTNYGQDTTRLLLEISLGDKKITDEVITIYDGYSTLFFSSLFNNEQAPGNYESLKKKWDFIIDARKPLIYNYVYHILDDLTHTDKEGFFKSRLNHWQRKRLLSADIPCELVRDTKPNTDSGNIPK